MAVDEHVEKAVKEVKEAQMILFNIGLDRKGHSDGVYLFYKEDPKSGKKQGFNLKVGLAEGDNPFSKLQAEERAHLKGLRDEDLSTILRQVLGYEYTKSAYTLEYTAGDNGNQTKHSIIFIPKIIITTARPAVELAQGSGFCKLELSDLKSYKRVAQLGSESKEVRKRFSEIVDNAFEDVIYALREKAMQQQAESQARERSYAAVGPRTRSILDDFE